jgi:membrane fusion protein (multidrug efflux system)
VNAPSAVGAAPESDITPRKKFAMPRNAMVVGLIALVIAVAGILWLMAPRTSESTDNAYLRADSSAVAPKVGGLVSAILVKDNQIVRAGQPLIRIDTQDYDARLAAARADVADSDAGVATARANLAALGAEEQLAAANLSAAGTGIASADAEYARAAADRGRYNALLAKGFATRRDAERINAAAVGAASAADRSRAERKVAAQQAGVARARRPVLEAQVQAAQAAALRARAALDLAQQNRDHTIVFAPIDGAVGNRQAQVGDFVQPGSRVLTLVPTGALYVVANFKETQTGVMRVGQKAEVYVDALGGRTLTGVVDSFAPGSGSEFTLLPFEPGSGNFTKIVQRVGVRIRLDPNQDAVTTLRPGLSVTAKVYVR